MFDLTLHTILIVRSGSRAYGTSTPESDVDIQGLVIPPKEYFLGYKHIFNETKGQEHLKPFAGLLSKEEMAITATKPLDGTLRDIRKFFKLASDCNPNVLELLFTDEGDILLSSKWADQLRENRNLFLSKRAHPRYVGYAMSQLHKIKTHRRYLFDPPTKAPTRTEFGLEENHRTIPKNQLDAAVSMITKKIDGWSIDFGDMEESEKIRIMEHMREAHVEMWTCSQEKYLDVARSLGFDDNFLEILDKERRYKTAADEWRNYVAWTRDRNPVRSELERKFGFDCYSEDTEFLTSAGWKRYDEISDCHLLATMNSNTHQLEFQRFSDRVKKLHTGRMGVLSPMHSNCMVTTGHNMFVSNVHRNKANKFSGKYDAETASWRLEPFQDLVASSRSHFHVWRTCEPSSAEHPVSDDYLTLMGAYISEGCVGKRLKSLGGVASQVRISQKVGGRVCVYMDALKAKHNFIRDFKFTHVKSAKRKNDCVERIWTVAHREWSAQLERECGSHSHNKKLPAWVLNLSGRQARLLLDVMIAGDGTKHGSGHVYYTVSKELADNVQAMCVASGVVSDVWGPYPMRGSLMYQVFVGEPGMAQTCTIKIAEKGSSNLQMVDVIDASVVCFTVPNGILITRRLGQVAVQGNCKHGAHLYRLLTTGEEILTTGTFTTKRPDAEWLLSIRKGAWTFDELDSWAEGQMTKMRECLKTSALPNNPNENKLDELCMTLVSDFHGW